MGAVKTHLPPLEVFERYEPRVQFNLIRGYHRKMAAKHRWFIREFEGDCYYMDGDELPKIDAVSYEIFDCWWTPTEWNIRPYIYRIFNDVVTEEYRAERSLPFPDNHVGLTVGYRRNGEWIWKYYDEGMRTFHRTKEGWYTLNNGIYTRYYASDGRILIGTFGNEIPVKGVLNGEILPVLKGMKAKKWRGFYDDDIEHVLQTVSIDRRYL